MIKVTAMRHPNSGFTLLELMVVLVIVGGITGLVMPNLVRLYEGISLTVERDSILDQLSNMGRVALLNQQTYMLQESPNYSDPDQHEVSTVSDYPPFNLETPPDWRITLDAPIIVRANGVCMGGNITLLYQGVPRFQTELKPPYCHVNK